MRDYETAILTYLRLAELAGRRGQGDGRDRFLLLAGIDACRAGLLDVAGRCREIVLAHNARHLVGRYDSLAEALVHPDFEPYRRRLERFCNYERAEHLLAGQGIETVLPRDWESPVEYAKVLLDRLED